MKLQTTSGRWRILAAASAQSFNLPRWGLMCCGDHCSSAAVRCGVVWLVAVVAEIDTAFRCWQNWVSLDWETPRIRFKVTCSKLIYVKYASSLIYETSELIQYSMVGPIHTFMDGEEINSDVSDDVWGCEAAWWQLNTESQPATGKWVRVLLLPSVCS